MSETREQFYARKNGGGRRTARKAFTCEQSLCLKKVVPGEVYFDTQEVIVWPKKKKRICIGCAEHRPT